MKIALDFDGTITRDRPMWAQFAIEAIRRGHILTIVTLRHGEVSDPDNRDIAEFMATTGIRSAIFTAGCQKADAYKADVWIDDMPEVIPTRESFRISQALNIIAAQQRQETE